MKHFFIITFFFMFNSFLCCQNEALIIKHVGEQDKSIVPLLISNYQANNKISTHLKAHKWSNPRSTDTIIVDSSFFKQLDEKWDVVVPKFKSEYTGLYGSFIVIWIYNDSIVKQIDLNKREESLLFFYKLSEIVEKFEKFEKKSTVLDRLRRRICRMYFQDEDCSPPPNNIRE